MASTPGFEPGLRHPFLPEIDEKIDHLLSIIYKKTSYDRLYQRKRELIRYFQIL